MPYRPRIIEQMPEWIDELADGDDCLGDVLTEAWVAGLRAHSAVRQRGGDVPRVFGYELQAADGILDALREGRVRPSMLAAKAAQAVRKFTTARECARSVESDDSPRFANERRSRR